jgi:hypothetical protein
MVLVLLSPVPYCGSHREHPTGYLLYHSNDHTAVILLFLVG